MLYGCTKVDGSGPLTDASTHLAGYTPELLAAYVRSAGFQIDSFSEGTDYHADDCERELGVRALCMRVEAVRDWTPVDRGTSADGRQGTLQISTTDAAAPPTTPGMTPDEEYMVPARVERRLRGEKGYGIAPDHAGPIGVYHRHDRARTSLEQMGGAEPSVLDVGCGNVVFVLHLGQLGYRASGVDPSRLAIDDARDYARRLRLACEFACAEAEALPYDDGAFDFVYCGQVLEHVRDPLAALREIRRVLRDGGVAVVDVPIEDMEPSPDHRRTFREAGFALLLAAANLAINSIERIPAGDPSGVPNIFAAVATRRGGGS
jgi:SAM-dependent methyltransferase